jgi:7-cyano-7-deazaguanine reductase
MTIEATHLGKQSNYPQHYDPSVLVAVPRILNREQYRISNDALPFSGVDVWHCYEFSFLTKKGTPVVGKLIIIYPASN